MSTELRRGVPADADKCGRICFEAFKVLADRHGFPQDFPSPEVASGLLSMLLAHPGFHGVVATRDGEIVGSNFMDERSSIVGTGPISVDPHIQSKGVGRLLMEHARPCRPEARAWRAARAGWLQQ
jgi:predicted N-acetyltransferase YhbS